MDHVIRRKKLIEVALPLEAINIASAREKSIRYGHPSTLHLWWARRPLAAARAVIFAQIVDDPSSLPDLFPTESEQESERQRLFRLLEQLVSWENTTNERLLSEAREELLKSWRRTCIENRNHPNAKELFDSEKLPSFYDPFAGGGALPLEAQRLGLVTFASDLNPVAVLMNKAMLEIPFRFAEASPINPRALSERNLLAKTWRGLSGLAEDVRHYGELLRMQAQDRIGNLYPTVEITLGMAQERPDLKQLVGQQFTLIACIWARTVKSPNPAFAKVDVPLVSTYMLATKDGNEAYVSPIIDDDRYRFVVRVGKPPNLDATKRGTRSESSGGGFQCLISGTPIPFDYIRREALAGRMGSRLMAIVAEGKRGRIFISPTRELEELALSAEPKEAPQTAFPDKALDLRVEGYGMSRWRDLFTARQLVALTTFSDLVQEVRTRVKLDAEAAGMPDDGRTLDAGGRGATAYADSVCIYLGLCLSKSADYWSNICIWRSDPKNLGIGHVFARQAISMTWDYAEANPFSNSSGGWLATLNWIVAFLSTLSRPAAAGHAFQADAADGHLHAQSIISTDPPYYDNIAYANLSDFFYVWLRRSLRETLPDLFATIATPKTEELIANRHLHGQRRGAEAFFLDGMTRAMSQIAKQTHPAFPATIYYAFKQSETKGALGTSSTGWETFLESVIRAGFTISGTWPINTELGNRLRNMNSNALASSIVLVCRPRDRNAATVTQREFRNELRSELPTAVKRLQRENIAPVDLAQSAIGPGMAVYTQYAKVLKSDGDALSVRDALAMINEALDEVLAEQEGDFDAESRWALAWFEQSGFADGEFGVAEMLSKAKNTSVRSLVDSGILLSRGGKVRLLQPKELAGIPDLQHSSLGAWHALHYLIRTLEANGEGAAAVLVARLGSQAEAVRELAYRLYTICERKKRAREALSYNGLVMSWTEIIRLSRDNGAEHAVQTDFLEATN